MVDERFDDDPAFAISVSQNATDKLREHLKTNADGIDYEDDPMLSPLDISNLGAGGNPSQHNAIIDKTFDMDNYIYNGEDDVPNDKDCNYPESETYTGDDSDGLEEVGPYLYRHPGAISSSLSVASVAASNSESGLDASDPTHSSERYIYDTRNVSTSPETLIGPSFTIVDSD